MCPGALQIRSAPLESLRRRRECVRSAAGIQSQACAPRLRLLRGYGMGRTQPEVALSSRKPSKKCLCSPSPTSTRNIVELDADANRARPLRARLVAPATRRAHPAPDRRLTSTRIEGLGKRQAAPSTKEQFKDRDAVMSPISRFTQKQP